MAVVDIPSLGAAAALSAGDFVPVTQGTNTAKKALMSAIASFVVASDSDLSAIAALTTTAFGRGLLAEVSAATLRTTLGLVIGTNVQAYDADLASIAALTTTAYGRSLLEAANAAALQTLAGLVLGTNVQAFDADLQSIAALSTTSYGRSLLETVDAAALRTVVGAETLGMLAGVNTQTANYTLALTDIGKVVEMNVASGNSLVVPANGTVAFAVGSRVDLSQIGAGQTTIVQDTGVTVRQRESKLKLAGQYAGASLYKRATNEWLVFGDLSA